MVESVYLCDTSSYDSELMRYIIRLLSSQSLRELVTHSLLIAVKVCEEYPRSITYAAP